jgi:glutathione S-transferase
LNRQCAGIKRDGGRCTTFVNGRQEYCYQHDPARAQERRRAASKAGKSKPSRELARLHQRLEELVEGVLEGSVDRADAAVAGQLINCMMRGLSVALKVREQEEIVERMERLERNLEANRRDRWGVS